jgi:hypothetical protein
MYLAFMEDALGKQKWYMMNLVSFCWLAMSSCSAYYLKCCILFKHMRYEGALRTIIKP